jgi:nucleoside-triphosphatase
MNIFITGNPRSGKSTLIKKLLEKLSGKKVSGIITPEIRVGGDRQGFKIIDLASGKEEILASANKERGPRVSKYWVNVEGMDFILDKFLESYPGSGYVVIDEIGMMEFYSRKFRDVVEMVISSQKTVIATLSRKFVGKFKTKGELLYLTRDNFDEVYNEVLSRVER